MPEQQSVQFKHTVNSRRSRRVVVRIRIAVQRHTDSSGLLEEVTHTLVVNAHGALIALSMSVQTDEKLVVKNWTSGENQQCRVVRVEEEPDEKNQVAIEFTKPVPHFWHIDFPPDDWKQLDD